MISSVISVSVSKNLHCERATKRISKFEHESQIWCPMVSIGRLLKSGLFCESHASMSILVGLNVSINQYNPPHTASIGSSFSDMLAAVKTSTALLQRVPKTLT